MRICGWSKRARARNRRLRRRPEGEGGRPAWSPDGSRLAAVIGDTDRFAQYSMNKMIVVPSNPPSTAGPATKPAIYMPSLIARSNLAWSADGQHHLPAGRSHEPISRRCRRRVRTAPRSVAPRQSRHLIAEPGQDGHFAVLAAEATRMNEVYALEGSNLRQLTKHNDSCCRSSWRRRRISSRRARTAPRCTDLS